jgi:PPP family 3-phenylpropionic acid transporter
MVMLGSRPQVLFFLLAGLVHWGCMQTYYFAYALHMQNVQAPPSYVGLGVNAGVVMEILAMWNYRRIAKKIPMLPLMLIGQFATIARWLVTGHLENGVALAALQAAHGLSFGLYFPACIDYLERVAPPEMRSTARALFASVSFGLGGVLGNILAGRMYDIGKGSLAFTAAGIVEGLAPLLLLAAWFCIPKSTEEPAK